MLIAHDKCAKSLNRGLFVCISLAAFIGLATSACGIRREVKVEVPIRILQAKSAGLNELVSLINIYGDKVSSLSSTTMKATYTAGKPESGVLQTYRSAPGYLLLKQPNRIRINIQNPITKTSIAEMLSVGDDFEVWAPSQNKLYIGSNHVRELEAEGQPDRTVFTIRPAHLFDAIIPAKLVPGTPGIWAALEEDQDATAKYYVLSVYREIGESSLYAVRKIWIDRSTFAISKQQFYEDDGKLIGIVRYNDFITKDDILLPLAIRIERPADGYILDLTFKSWKLNPILENSAFMLTTPEGAERIQLKEKGRSNKP
jgi:outer membrane lipoprotein-sorting protein